MKICIIGPGIMPIPPSGWGACEILIHDTRCELERLGHEVIIVNTKEKGEIIRKVNECNPDFVHVHYDEHIDVVPYLECKKVVATSHYGYLEQPHRWGDYARLVRLFISTNVNIFALSPGIAEIYVRAGADPDRVLIVPNGVREDLFTYHENPSYTDRSIYLAKIDDRKRQHIFQHIPGLYFAGNCIDPRFDLNSKQYLGEWTKNYLYENLSHYGNLVLLSDGEAHPLVCTEAMVCGLGLVISEVSTANLDLSRKFIDVIPESKIRDLPYIYETITKNREISKTCREEIREYALSTFPWSKMIERFYVPAMNFVLGSDKQ